MCCYTFLVLDRVSCYAQCPLQPFDYKEGWLSILNIILGANMEALG
jgi:hypothetical protein